MLQLHFGRRARALVSALRDAAVSVDVVAVIFFVEKFIEFFHLHKLLQKRDFRRFLRGSVGHHKAATHRGPVEVGGAAELFALLNGEIGVATHNGAHLDSSVLPLSVGGFTLHQGRESLAADAVGLFVNDVVVVPVFFKVHCRTRSGGPAADDANSYVFVFHIELLIIQ